MTKIPRGYKIFAQGPYDKNFVAPKFYLSYLYLPLNLPQTRTFWRRYLYVLGGVIVVITEYGI